MDEPIPSKKHEHYVEVSDDTPERALILPHIMQDSRGQTRRVMPAIVMFFGEMIMDDKGGTIATIRIDALYGSGSLVFAPTVHEMRTMGKAMMDAADRTEKGAGAMLADALRKKPGA